jgi:protein SCO1/2
MLSKFHKVLLGVSLGSLLGAGIMYVVLPSAITQPMPQEQAAETSGSALIGGSFTLTNQNGEIVTEQTFRGQNTLVFFGFSMCPDVCPQALNKVTEALNALPAEQQEKITPIFISVDPERDTPEQLKSYLAPLHPRFVGLTGTEEQLASVRAAYRVYAARAPKADAPDGYVVDHSAIVYWMNPNGQFVKFFDSEATAAEITQGLAAGL